MFTYRRKVPRSASSASDKVAPPRTTSHPAVRAFSFPAGRAGFWGASSGCPAKQGCQLLGKLHHLRIAQGGLFIKAANQAFRFQRSPRPAHPADVAGILQLVDDLVVRGHIHLPFEHLAGRHDRLVVEEGHLLESRESGIGNGEWIESREWGMENGEWAKRKRNARRERGFSTIPDSHDSDSRYFSKSGFHHHPPA